YCHLPSAYWITERSQRRGKLAPVELGRLYSRPGTPAELTSEDGTGGEAEGCRRAPEGQSYWGTGKG
ncbi:MAG: hypothetical protein ACO1G7_10670, partial [Bacteroidota bacterium]